MTENVVHLIEKNIPLPRKGHSPGRKPKYPLEQLAVGDSFLVSHPAKPISLLQRNITGRLARRARSLGISVTTRIVKDGVRVWRVA